jgi:hydroxypyruvate isomerase
MPDVRDGRLRQSVCKWCFPKMSVEELAVAAKRIGLVGIDLLSPGDFETLKKHDLICTMTNSHGIAEGLNRKENHEKCLKSISDAIDATSAAGFPNVICFSGNRGGMSDEEGLQNCAEALKQIVGYAEEKKITLHMELLNSKRNHADYMCDRTHWGAELVKAVGSERFKLLYDIYHMQVQEGDVIATIRENKDYIGHYHTAGVPGRNEPDDSQELQYRTIARAVADLGFEGIFAHEFVPKNTDGIASLEAAAKMCVV